MKIRLFFVLIVSIISLSAFAKGKPVKDTTTTAECACSSGWQSELNTIIVDGDSLQTHIENGTVDTYCEQSIPTDSFTGTMDFPDSNPRQFYTLSSLFKNGGAKQCNMIAAETSGLFGLVATFEIVLGPVRLKKSPQHDACIEKIIELLCSQP